MLYLPRTPLADDPDGDALRDGTAKPSGPKLVAQNSPVIYGGVRKGNHIDVVALDEWPIVDGPAALTSHNGIEVDPYHIWVFGKHGIACATHASMIKSVQKKITPAWIIHKFEDPFKKPEVNSLSPARTERFSSAC